jgi:hypothetical protein
MNQLTLRITASLAIVAGAATLSADILRFVGSRKAIDEVKVNSDTLRGVSWQKADGGVDSVRPWELESYKLVRNVANGEKFEDSVNKAASLGAQGSWRAVEAEATKALDAKAPPAYPNVDGMLLRLRYYKLRALLEQRRSKEDVEKAWQAYTEANKKYAELIARDRANTAGAALDKGERKGLYAVTLHSTTIDAYVALGDWHRAAGRYDDAWKLGYQPASDIGQECFAAQRTVFDYLSRWSIPVLRRAATMFLEVVDKDGKAAPAWDKAEPIFNLIAKLAADAREDALAKWAQMREARCKLNTPGKEDAARRTYDDALAAFRRSRESGGPGTPGYRTLTPDLASVYAEAANGLGYIAERKKNDTEALKQFSLSLTFFSANSEARAEALYQAGQAMARLGAAKDLGRAAKDGYKRGGEAYLNELKLTLSDTEFGKRAEELAAALRAIG